VGGSVVPRAFIPSATSLRGYAVLRDTCERARNTLIVIFYRLGYERSSERKWGSAGTRAKQRVKRGEKKSKEGKAGKAERDLVGI